MTEDSDPESPLRLNVGAGGKALPKFVNIDLRRVPLSDLSATALSLPFPSDSVDEVLASDCLEHVDRAMVPAAIAEWHRVLKPGGLLKVKTPDLRALSQAYVSGTMPVSEFSRKIYGNQEAGDPANFHRSGLDADRLRELLGSAGFQDVRVGQLDGVDLYNIGARARKAGSA